MTDILIDNCIKHVKGVQTVGLVFFIIAWILVVCMNWQFNVCSAFELLYMSFN